MSQTSICPLCNKRVPIIADKSTPNDVYCKPHKCMLGITTFGLIGPKDVREK